MSTPRSLQIPAGVRPDRLTTERGEFAVLDAAPPGWSESPDRSAALLVPGWTGSKEDFLAILAGLAAAGQRVVAVDQRGQYETPGPDDPGAYTLDSFAADAVGMAAALESDRVHLVGHSFGGLVARAAVLHAPDAFASLTLMSSGPAALDDPESSKMLALMVEAIPGFGLARTYDSKRELERANGSEEPPPEIETFLRDRFCANAPTSLVSITRHLLEAPDRVDALADTTVPKLVTYGDLDDAWSPETQAKMADRLSAESAVIADCGHSPAVEQPERTVEILRKFWAAA